MIQSLKQCADLSFTPSVDRCNQRVISTVMRMTILVVAAAIIGLGLTFWGVASMWAQMGVNMTMHGWIAYGLGIVASIALAGGLFYLTFKSAREGYDDIDRPEDLNE